MSIPILDTHQHLIYPEKYSYGWTRELPALADRAFRYDDYLRAAEGCGITGTIFMETTPDGSHYRDEVRLVQELSRQPGSLIRGMIARAKPEDHDFAFWLDELPRPFVVGIRRILHVEPDGLSQSDTFVAGVKLLGKQNLTFDFCVRANQIPLATRLARKCPGVQFVLDHCGMPGIAGGNLKTWQADVGELASLPNVACKVSGLPTYCTPGQATADAIRPVVQYVIETFGTDRLIWASDWPVLLINSDLRSWVEVTWELLADCDAAMQAKILSGNAARIYGLRASGAAD